MATLATTSLKSPSPQDNDNNKAKANDLPIAAGSTGSVIATTFFACFAPGGQFRYKTADNTAPAAQKNKDAFAASSALCGAAGATPASAAASGGPINMHGCSGTTCKGSETITDVTSLCTDSHSAKTRQGLCMEASPSACACGTSGMPTDACAGLATADVKTKCTATSDGGSPAKKCCLATFDALPTTYKSGGNKAVVTPTKGGKVDGTKYYGCYKSSSGKIRFKTATDAVTADQSKEAWVSAALFCATDKVGKAQTGATYGHTVSTTVTGSATGGVLGTAKTCVCGTSNIFAIGFTLLAILASLWK